MRLARTIWRNLWKGEVAKSITDIGRVRYDVSALGISGLPGLWKYITLAIGVGFSVTALVTASAVAGKKIQCWGNTQLVM